ncbi:MAG: hypothetical protein CL843_08880 [Crocinitomicaceae bacterium]|nr:hypothetical protein [Crocinitomicaceae bacterium]|tara:strand:+ start:9813 stop:10859 length:1047 start_codon:yes stop_codon:yes gene_type:complete
MKTYKILQALGFKKHYALKFLFVAFLGIHIPLIGFVIYIIFQKSTAIDEFSAVVLLLTLTLIATGCTLYILNRLLSPIRLAGKAMNIFQQEQRIIDLPTNYDDEAGRLLLNIRTTFEHINKLTEERRDFTSLMSHDLRSPLTSILGLSEVISTTSSDKEAAECAGNIRQLGEKLMLLISDTLTWLKSDGYEIKKDDMKMLPLREIINEEITSLNGFAIRKKIHFNVEVDPNEQVKVHPQFFSHIIQNLLSNAVKFSFDEGAVHIKSIRTNKTLHLEIIDEGMGFSPEKSNAIFERFTKEGRKGTDGEASSGIGLYLTKNLVEKHNGKIYAQSEGENKGAIFSIELPTS